MWEALLWKLVIVLLMLLSGADEVFSYYLSNIWDYINIKNVLIIVVAVVVLLFALISIVSLIRNYSFGKRRKISLKRSKRRKKDGIDFDRYTKGPDGF